MSSLEVSSCQMRDSACKQLLCKDDVQYKSTVVRAYGV